MHLAIQDGDATLYPESGYAEPKPFPLAEGETLYVGSADIHFNGEQYTVGVSFTIDDKGVVR